MAINFLVLGLLAMTSSLALASDGNGLQDFCVTDPNSSVILNGKACKNPQNVTANDFFISGLQIAGNTSNAFGSKVTPVFAAQIPGLNTLGMSMARIDLAPWGINPLHTHPRATEILTVIEGTMEVGFVTAASRLFTKVLNKGDVFVFPEGLVHYQRNVGESNAFGVAALNSQNPGVMTIGNAVFGSNPSLSTDVLTKTFDVDSQTITQVQSRF